MKILSKSLVVVMLALALSAVTASQSNATCTGSDKVTDANAACMTATWTNTTTANGIIIDWTITHNCTGYGKLDALFVNGADNEVTSTLSSSTPALSGRGMTLLSEGGLAAVYCCKDDDGLCNKSDVVTASSCETRYDSSTASSSCTRSSTAVSSDHADCVFGLDCSGTAVDATVAWPDVPDMRYCSGTIFVSDANAACMTFTSD